MYSYMDDVNSLVSALSITLKNPNFYIPKVLEFFRTYMDLPINRTKPLDAITYDDINTYLQWEDVKRDYSNQYYGLKKFFDFTYKERRTQEIMSRVTPPPVNSTKKPKYIPVQHIEALERFVLDTQQNIKERLLIGLFLYTGLSRRFLWTIQNNEIYFNGSSVTLNLINPAAVIPITPKFAPVLIQYKTSINPTDTFKKVFDFKRGEDVNPILGKITKTITGKKYTPTHFSNSFILQCLKVSPDIYSISKLLLENPSSILKHLTLGPEEIYERQRDIVEIAFK